MVASFLLVPVLLLLVSPSQGFSFRPPVPIRVLTSNDKRRFGFCRGYTLHAKEERDFDEAAFHLSNDDSINHDSVSGNDRGSTNNNMDGSPGREFDKSSKIGFGATSFTKEGDGKNNTFGRQVKKNPMDDDRIQTFKPYLKPLFRMMRPGNFPGIILFHFVGIHRTLLFLHQQNNIDHDYTIKIFIQTIVHPSILATLFALLLLVSTSMIVNDYYDALSVDYLKFQRQSKNSIMPTGSSKNNGFDTKPLASGQVSLPLVKKILNILYGTLLLNTTILPGRPTRILVVLGSMLTFYYTKHLKPKLWFKNVSCAILMSLSPLTSGVAVTELLENNYFDAWKALGPLIFSLFCGFMGRELIMDITDHSTDKDAGIYTVPVTYGKRVTSRIILFFSIGAASISINPLREVWGAFTLCSLRRLSCALIGSLWLIFRAIQIVNSEGEDERLLCKSIEEAKLHVLFFLASSI